MQVMTAACPFGQPAFGEPVAVTTAGKFVAYDKPWASVGPRGKLLVAYGYSRSGGSGVALAYSTDGSRFDEHRVVYAHDFGGALPVVCAGTASNTVFIAWYDRTRGIVLRASEDLTTWPDAREAVVSLPGEGVALEAPSCAVDASAVTLVYGLTSDPPGTSSSAFLSAAVVARSRNAGRTFDDRVVVTEPAGGITHPAVAVDGSGATHVVYYAGARPGSADGSIRHTVIEPGAASARASEVVRQPIRLVGKRNAEGWMGDYLAVAPTGSGLLLAAVDNTTGAARARPCRGTYAATLEPWVFAAALGKDRGRFRRCVRGAARCCWSRSVRRWRSRLRSRAPRRIPTAILRAASDAVAWSRASIAVSSWSSCG